MQSFSDRLGYKQSVERIAVLSYSRRVGMKRTHSGINAGRGELALLAELRKRAARSSAGGLRLGIGDDCALLAPRRGEELAVTTDLSIDGHHFRLNWHQPEAVGHRALARGLSDLAAMGARPVAAFLSLGLPRSLTKTTGRRSSWVECFLDGFLALAEAHNTPLAGGDLAESPVAVADIVLVGAVPREGRALSVPAHGLATCSTSPAHSAAPLPACSAWPS